MSIVGGPPIFNEENMKDIFEIMLDEAGLKEKDNKLDYSEINFRLLDLMAKRFTDNKFKYPKGNNKKEIDKNDLLWAMFRHLRKILHPIKGDVESYEEHLAAIGCNLSMIIDQLDLESEKIS